MVFLLADESDHVFERSHDRSQCLCESRRRKYTESHDIVYLTTTLKMKFSYNCKLICRDHIPHHKYLNRNLQDFRCIFG